MLLFSHFRDEAACRPRTGGPGSQPPGQAASARALSQLCPQQPDTPRILSRGAGSPGSSSLSSGRPDQPLVRQPQSMISRRARIFPDPWEARPRRKLLSCGRTRSQVCLSHSMLSAKPRYCIPQRVARFSRPGSWTGEENRKGKATSHHPIRCMKAPGQGVGGGLEVGAEASEAEEVKIRTRGLIRSQKAKMKLIGLKYPG